MLPVNPKNLLPKRKQPRVYVEVLNDTVIKNKIRTNDDLVLFHKRQSMEDKRDIQRCLLTHTNPKQRQDFLDTAWLIELHGGAARDTILRMQCASTLELLSKKSIDPISFDTQVANALTKGRGKGPNLFIVVPKKLIEMIHTHTIEHYFWPLCLSVKL